MRQKFFNLVVNTSGQRLYENTDQTIEWCDKNKFSNGMLNLSIQHTSASLIVQENADPPAPPSCALPFCSSFLFLYILQKKIEIRRGD